MDNVSQKGNVLLSEKSSLDAEEIAFDEKLLRWAMVLSELMFFDIDQKAIDMSIL